MSEMEMDWSERDLWEEGRREGKDRKCWNKEVNKVREIPAVFQGMFILDEAGVCVPS